MSIAAVSPHDRFFSKCGNMWEVLSVDGDKARVIRQSYYFDGEWFFPDGETPACFDVASLLGMQKVDSLGFFVTPEVSK
jgi:hypothetical protein